MTAEAILEEIEPLGQESYKKVLLNHGVPEPCFGVKIEELQKIRRRVKVDYRLALELYDTGIYDAMYLAGLIADDAKMTKEDLQHWVDEACDALAGSTVPQVAAGGPYAREMALRWIESDKSSTAGAGWATLSCMVSVKEDRELDVPELRRLLRRVQKTIHQSPDRVRYQMNGFVIAAGCYVKALTDIALEIGEKIGPVTVDMGNTSCKVPFAPEYIRKVERRGTIGKKRKSAKC